MKYPTIDLILWEERPASSGGIEWPAGKVHRVQPIPESACQALGKLAVNSPPEFILFWDKRLGSPDLRRVREALSRPNDLWHAGLRLGMGGLPRLMDFVHPTWMLNCDPDPTIEATSWRLSLRAFSFKEQVRCLLLVFVQFVLVSLLCLIPSLNLKTDFLFCF